MDLHLILVIRRMLIHKAVAQRKNGSDAKRRNTHCLMLQTLMVKTHRVTGKLNFHLLLLIFHPRYFLQIFDRVSLHRQTFLHTPPHRIPHAFLLCLVMSKLPCLVISLMARPDPGAIIKRSSRNEMASPFIIIC